jgi:lipase chaperone LimK
MRLRGLLAVTGGAGLVLLAGLALIGRGAADHAAPTADARRTAPETPRDALRVVGATSAVSDRPADAPQPSSAATGAALLAWRALDASLRGSGIDGAVQVGSHGDVVPDAALRRLFDHVLALFGERSPAQLRSLLAEHVQQLHGPAVAQQVLDLFDRYVGLQAAIARADLAAIADPAERLHRLAALRRNWFDAAGAEAMFGEDERYAEYAVRRIALAADRTRDATARAADVAALEATLPEPTRAALAQARTPDLLLEQQRQFDQLGVDAASRRDERAALWGEAAADRLAALDAERAAWDARLQDYVAARESIRRDASLSPAARERRIDALRAERFDAAGARRVAALEAIGRLGSY